MPLFWLFLGMWKNCILKIYPHPSCCDAPSFLTLTCIKVIGLFQASHWQKNFLFLYFTKKLDFILKIQRGYKIFGKQTADIHSLCCLTLRKVLIIYLYWRKRHHYVLRKIAKGSWSRKHVLNRMLGLLLEHKWVLFGSPGFSLVLLVSVRFSSVLFGSVRFTWSSWVFLGCLRLSWVLLGTVEFSGVQWSSLGFSWVQLSSFGFPWVHLGFLGCLGLS